jgi:hypothetical protein
MGILDLELGTLRALRRPEPLYFRYEPTKNKGRRLENLVANTLMSNGIPAERTPLSGSLGGKYRSDCIIGTRDNILRTIECKSRLSCLHGVISVGWWVTLLEIAEHRQSSVTR